MQPSEHPYLDAVDPSGRLGQLVDAVKLPYTLYRAHQAYHEQLAADLRRQQLLQRNIDLHESIRHNQPERTRQLINDGAQLNWQDEHGDTALHKAVTFGRTDIVKQLKDKSNLSLTNQRGQTALDMAHALPEGKTKESILTLFNPDRAKELKEEQTKTAMQRQADLDRQLTTSETDEEKKRPLAERPSLARHQEHKAKQIAKGQQKITQVNQNRNFLLGKLPEGKLFFDDVQEAQDLLDQRNKQLEEQRRQAAQPRKMGPVPKRGSMLKRPAHTATLVFPTAGVG